MSEKATHLYSAQEVRDLVTESGMKTHDFSEEIGVATGTFYAWCKSGVPAKGGKIENIAAITAAFEDRDDRAAPLIQVDRQADRMRDDITAMMRQLTPHQLVLLRDHAINMQLETLTRKYAKRIKALNTTESAAGDTKEPTVKPGASPNPTTNGQHRKKPKHEENRPVPINS